MGSRLRESPDKLFEVFMEVAKPNEHNAEPFILQQYPEDYDDQEVLISAPRFASPCDLDCGTVDHFSFVITDIDSKFRFGFCRHTPGAPTTLCIVSCLPWFEIFYKLLNMVAEILNRTEMNSPVPLLEETYNHEIPMPRVPVTIVAQQEMFNFGVPDPNQLPTIPANRNLTEYYNAIDTNNMMIIFAHMLNERRMIFTSKKLSRLTACIHAAQALLYPMCWQHLFIPLLPAYGSFIEYVGAPMPYLIGVHSSLLPKVMRLEIGDAVIVDCDNDSVTTCHNDFQDLPEDVASYLKKCLRADKLKISMMESQADKGYQSGDAISRAFLESLVRLIGGYRDALRFRPGEDITFDPETFVMTRSDSMQKFLENMLQLQIFQQFINGRLDMLNSGYGFSDIFEQQSMTYSDKLNTQKRYKDWHNQMKKQGKKLQKSGRDMWSDIKEKVKSQSKKAISDFKAKINEMNEKTAKSSPRSNNSSPAARTTPRPRPTTVVGTALKTNTDHTPSRKTPKEELDIKTSLSSLQEKSSEKANADNMSIHSLTIDVVTDKRIGPPPRPPKPKIYNREVEPSPLITFDGPPSRPPKPKIYKKEAEPNPLISFEEPPKPPVRFHSEDKQNDLLLSMSQKTQSPSHVPTLTRSGAFRQSDRSPKVAAYKANLYNPSIGLIDNDSDASKLFDPFSKDNCDIKLPDVKQPCNNEDLLGDFMPEPGTSNQTFGSSSDLSMAMFDPLANSSVSQGSSLLNISRQSDSRGSAKSLDELFTNASLEADKSDINFVDSCNTSSNSISTPRKTDWQTFD